MTTEAERPEDDTAPVAGKRKSRLQRKFERCKPLDPTAPYSGGSNAVRADTEDEDGGEASPAAYSHARVLEPGTYEHLKTPQERTAYIAELMATREWNKKTSRPFRAQLSAAWGVTADTISTSYAHVASQMALDAMKELRPALAQKALDGLEWLIDAEPEFPGDRGAKATAIKIALEHIGIDKPEENQPRQSTVTVVQVGSAATSPALQAMFGPAKVLPEPVSGVVHEAVPVPG